MTRGPQGAPPPYLSTWKRPAYRSAVAEPGPHTRSIRRPDISTSPAATRLPNSRSARARGKTSYTDSVVVLDAKTGDYKYHFKLVPKDWHDWDVSNPPVLIQTMGGKLGQGGPISRNSLA